MNTDLIEIVSVFICANLWFRFFLKPLLPESSSGYSDYFFSLFDKGEFFGENVGYVGNRKFNFCRKITQIG